MHNLGELVLYHLQPIGHPTLLSKVSSEFQQRIWEVYFPASPSLCSPRFEHVHGKTYSLDIVQPDVQSELSSWEPLAKWVHWESVHRTFSEILENFSIFQTRLLMVLVFWAETTFLTFRGIFPNSGWKLSWPLFSPEKYKPLILYKTL